MPQKQHQIDAYKELSTARNAHAVAERDFYNFTAPDAFIVYVDAKRELKRAEAVWDMSQMTPKALDKLLDDLNEKENDDE